MTSIVGQAILPAAAFQAALAGSELHFAADERRLKAGCSRIGCPSVPGMG